MKHLLRLGLSTLFILLLFSPSWAAIEPAILRLSMESEPTTLDWNRVHSGNERFIVSFLMRGLMKYEKGTTLTCDLCQSWSISPDKKVLTFRINTEEKWSDGNSLDAKHFVDSFRRLLDPATKSPAAEDFGAILGAPERGTKKWDPSKLGVRATGPATLEITLSEPLAVFPHLLTTVAAFPIRKELIRPKDDGEGQATAAIIGPYQLAAWERGKRIVIEGNPGFKGTRPVYRVEFILGDHAKLGERFKKGRIDILSSPTTEDLVKIQNRRVQVNPYWATRALMFNLQKKPLSQLSFRKAILLGLDRPSLPAYLKSGERAATGIVPPGLPGYRELPLTTLDLDRAQAERKKTPPADQPVNLRLLVLDTDLEKRVGHWLAEQLQKIQIHLSLHPMSSQARAAALEKGEFDLALMTWAFGIANPLEMLQNFHTHAPGNPGKWTHVTFDALIEQMYRAPGGETLSPLIDQAGQILERDEVGLIPLSYPTQTYLLGGRVLNFATTPFGDPDLVRIQLKQASQVGLPRTVRAP